MYVNPRYIVTYPQHCQLFFLELYTIGSLSKKYRPFPFFVSFPFFRFVLQVVAPLFVVSRVRIDRPVLPVYYRCIMLSIGKKGVHL